MTYIYLTNSINYINLKDVLHWTLMRKCSTLNALSCGV